MKKYIGISFVIASMLSPVFVFAQQTDVAPTGTNQCANIASNIGYGSRDSGDISNVAMLQDFLSSSGYLKVPTTGFFGKNTVVAVKAFQSANGITPTGYVGQFTRAKITAIDCNGETNATVQSNGDVNIKLNINRPDTKGTNNDNGSVRKQPMTEVQARAMVSSLGITGSAANALVSALTKISKSSENEGMHLAESLQSSQSAVCGPDTAPSITITNPAANVTYTAGTAVAVTWQACHVSTFTLGLVSGGKDFGELYSYHNLDIDVSQAQHGSYQWTVTNPAKDFTGASANNYQIIAQSQSPNVLGKSGMFSVQANTTNVNQANTTPKLVELSGNHGLFTAKSYGLSMVKVYTVPTGTGVTDGVLFGTMSLEGTDAASGAQYWSLPAPAGGLSVTSVYAIGYTKDTQINTVYFPYTNLSDINSHLYQ